jgi:hypothetical protein
MRAQHRSHFRFRALLLLSVPLFLAGIPTSPAFAASDEGSIGTQVVLRGRAVVASGETAASVVIFDGPATIDGIATGSVVAFHGLVTISGTVRGDVLSMSDRVVLLSGAEVDGDVHSQKTATIAADATVGGTVGGVNLGRFDQGARIGRYLWWLGVTISTLLLGLMVLLLPAGAETALSGAAKRTGRVIGWGLLAFFGLPVLAIALLAVVVAIPLGLALLFALGLLYLVGYVVTAWVLGRAIVRGRAARFLVFLAGWGVLRAIGLVPVLGGTMWTLATIFGLGVVARVVSLRRSPAPQPVTAAPPPVPPPPPPP